MMRSTSPIIEFPKKPATEKSARDEDKRGGVRRNLRTLNNILVRRHKTRAATFRTRRSNFNRNRPREKLPMSAAGTLPTQSSKVRKHEGPGFLLRFYPSLFHKSFPQQAFSL
jgi:hypothetical protein